MLDVLYGEADARPRGASRRTRRPAPPAARSWPPCAGCGATSAGGCPSGCGARPARSARRRRLRWPRGRGRAAPGRRRAASRSPGAELRYDAGRLRRCAVGRARRACAGRSPTAGARHRAGDRRPCAPRSRAVPSATTTRPLLRTRGRADPRERGAPGRALLTRACATSASGPRPSGGTTWRRSARASRTSTARPACRWRARPS